MTIEEAVKRERLSDELSALQWVNVAQFPTESYEENLKRRAAYRVRRDEILRELAW